MGDDYATWARELERFARGDDGALDELNAAQLHWQPGVAERLVARVHASLGKRLRELQRRLERDLQRPVGGTPGDVSHVGQALTRAKRSVRPLVSFVQLPAFPSELSDTLQRDLRRFIQQMQDSLEQSSRPERHGHSLVHAEIRANRLTTVLAQLDAPRAHSPAPVGELDTSPLGRRLIL